MTRFGVLGTGNVGQTIAGKLASLGHEVRMGSRQAGNEKAVAWVEAAGEGASQGSFADAAAFGEVVVRAPNVRWASCSRALVGPPRM